MKPANGGYAQSIHAVPKGKFDYEIVSESKLAERIEYGTKEIDMKKTHTKGPRSRIVKSGPNKGKSYLIVPFRWGTPPKKGETRVGFKNVMPNAIYNMMLNKKNKFQISRETVSADNADEKHKTPNARGEMVGRAQYAWGDRVSAQDVSKRTAGGKEDHYMDNMVRMDGKNKNGETISSGYFTFRIIPSWGTKGWIKPAVKARPVTKAVADVAREGVNNLIQNAVKEELANLL
jgi:hypothetical protein